MHVLNRIIVTGVVGIVYPTDHVNHFCEIAVSANEILSANIKHLFLSKILLKLIYSHRCSVPLANQNNFNLIQKPS